MTPNIAKQPVKPPRLSMKMLHDLILEQQQLNDQLMRRLEVLEHQLELRGSDVMANEEETLPAPVEPQDEPSALLDDSLSAQDMLSTEEQLPLDELIHATLNPVQTQIAASSETKISPVLYSPISSDQDSWSCIETPRSMRHPAPAKKRRIWDRIWHWSGVKQSQTGTVTPRLEAGHSGHPRLSLDLPHEPMRLRSSSE